MDSLVILIINMLWAAVVFFGFTVVQKWLFRESSVSKAVTELAGLVQTQATMLRAMRTELDTYKNSPSRKVNF